MTVDWRDLLVAWLHDPPDKALDIRSHQGRARRYAAAALGDQVSESEQKDQSDALAAIAERLPCPRWEKLRVGVEEGRLLLRHPLSGTPRPLDSLPHTAEDVVSAAIADLVSDTDSTQDRFLTLWRLLPGRLAKNGTEWFADLPADTRVPDHSIWRHLDITAGLKGADAGGAHGAAFLSFSLGPVQPFIAAARSVRDLWSGSMLLAWLTWQGLLPVVEELGPTAVVYPYLRGTPWLDQWLQKERGITAFERPDEVLRYTPCIPNRFLAVVPWGLEGADAEKLAQACRRRSFDAWRGIAQKVHDRLDQNWRSIDADWDRRWQEQIESYFDIRAAVLPWKQISSDEAVGKLLAGSGGFAAAFPEVEAVRAMGRSIPKDEQPGYGQANAGRWQARVELSARLMQSLRNVRHVPPATVVSDSQEKLPPKCSLLGTYEQMGPADRDEANEFWRHAARKPIGGVHVRDGERLCAVSLVKRFCGPCFFKDQLELDKEILRYEDTATIAATEWLESAEIHPDHVREDHGYWSGQWLHWPQKNPKGERELPCPDDVWVRIKEARSRRDLPSPPAYYAVLAMDGDHMGRWLKGEQSPQVKEIISQETKDYFTQIADGGDGVPNGLNARRPLGPALHAAISEALANFALHFVPGIVEDHGGTLIYAGGDDVLALLPTRRSLACAKKLNDTFRRDWKEDDENTNRLLMGRSATVSAGLAVVHYKEDLRFALDTARQAEKTAKQAGRDAVQVTACRRSGEHASAWCGWPYVETLTELVGAFERGASDRWAYRLRAESSILQEIPMEAQRAEIARLVNRSENETREQLAGSRDDRDKAGDMIGEQFQTYVQQRLDGKKEADGDVSDQNRLAGAFDDFVTLCQTASFLARGRDV